MVEARVEVGGGVMSAAQAQPVESGRLEAVLGLMARRGENPPGARTYMVAVDRADI